MATRRDALKTLAVAASATPALADPQHEHHGNAAPVRIAAPRQRKLLTETQFALLSRMVDLIIPRSETPGAVDAGVPYLIDRQATLSAGLQHILSTDLAEVDVVTRRQHQAPFLELGEAQQVALLTQWSEQGPTTQLGRFFDTVKGLTVDLYYTTPEGLKQELGWNANTFLPEFRGCTHPEHQVQKG